MLLAALGIADQVSRYRFTKSVKGMPTALHTASSSTRSNRCSPLSYLETYDCVCPILSATWACVRLESSRTCRRSAAMRRLFVLIGRTLDSKLEYSNLE